MWRSYFVLCLALAISGERVARAQLAMTKSTTPYPGVTHQIWTDPSVPVKLHLMLVDVSSQEIHLSATQSSERGHTVTDWADCVGGASGCVMADVAINGDLFTPLGFVPQGLAIGGGKPWADASMDNATEGFFAFGRPGDVNAVYLSDPSVVEKPPASLGVNGAVGGRSLLVEGSQPLTAYDPADPTGPYRFGPRTAIGIDGATPTHIMYLAVVDGDQASSVGMTAEGLADFLASQGVSMALELDGGGSSELFVRAEKGVVSSPSDGVERQVANQLGIAYGQSPYRFTLVGEIYNTVFNDPTKLINNATVYVDSVLVTLWTATSAGGNHTLYNISNIAPHFVCAHGSAPGFHSDTQCRQITENDVITMGNTQYLSMTLYPCPSGQTTCDPPPDMAKPADMAHPFVPPDFAMTRDAGATDDAGLMDVSGSGCSMTSRPSVPAFPWLLVVVFLGAAGKPRRAR
jgi:hypothetical protein